MSPRVFLLLIAGIGLTTFASAQPDVPALTGRVVDRADLLSPTVEAAITERLAAHEDSTTDQVALLTIPSLNGEVLEEYATTVFRTWGLGVEELDNGVLLLIARDDRKIRIEVGYGLEGDLTDQLSGIIIREEMTPRYRAGDFEGGTLGAVEAIVAVLEGTYEEPVTRSFAGMPESDRITYGEGLLTSLLFCGLPVLLAIVGVLRFGPVGRTLTLLISMPFIGIGAMILAHTPSGVTLGWAFVIGFLLMYLVLSLWMGFSSWGRRQREIQRAAREKKRRLRDAFARARKRGDTSIRFEGQTYTVPTYSSSSSGSSSYSSSSFSSSSSSSSFSGGGGSSGGGGASGGW